MLFEWDEAKAATNLEKHGVAFEESCTLWEDPLFIVFADPDHSDDESRFLIFGQSNQGRLLVVSFTENEERTRLISAREATAAERKFYEEEI